MIDYYLEAGKIGFITGMFFGIAFWFTFFIVNFIIKHFLHIFYENTRPTS